EEGRGFDAGERRLELIETVDGKVSGDLDAERANEVLLGEAVLRHGEGFGSGKSGSHARASLERSGGHVLEFAGHDVDGGGELRKRLLICVTCDRARRGDVEG